MLGALRETQGQQAAAEGVHQAVAGGIQGFDRFNAVIEYVVGDVLQHLIVIRAVVQIDIGTHRVLRSLGGRNVISLIRSLSILLVWPC
ncbi:hypothetical protein D3C80_2064260 [compost metagenome]